MAGLSSIAMRPKYHGPVALYGNLLEGTPFRSIPSLAAMPGCHAFDVQGPGGKGGDGVRSGVWAMTGEAGIRGGRLISSSPTWTSTIAPIVEPPEDVYIRTYFREMANFGTFSSANPAIPDGVPINGTLATNRQMKAETTNGSLLSVYRLRINNSGFGYTTTSTPVRANSGRNGRHGNTTTSASYNPAQANIDNFRYREPVGNPLNFPRRISDRTTVSPNSSRRTSCTIAPLRTNGSNTLLTGYGMGGAGGLAADPVGPGLPGCSGAVLYWYIYG